MPAYSIVVVAMPLNLDGHFIDERSPPSDIRDTDYALRNACMTAYETTVVSQLRKRVTRRCVSAATGACC
jgi:hypothetical protein